MNPETVLIAKKLSIPRAIGTPGHSRVKQLLIHYARVFGFRVVLQRFRRRVRGHVYQFTNLLAVNPFRDRRKVPLVLSAHYDGPFSASEEFEAASDSAVSCAMILTLGGACLAQYPQMNIMLMFLDGEESVGGVDEWDDDLTLSGATYMAASGVLPKNARILFLDLIGAPSLSHIPFYIHSSRDAAFFLTLCRVCPDRFRYEASLVNIEDDPTPFYRDGYTRILHLIPWPFADTHHTARDTFESIDWNAVQDIWKAIWKAITEYY